MARDERSAASYADDDAKDDDGDDEASGAFTATRSTRRTSSARPLDPWDAEQVERVTRQLAIVESEDDEDHGSPPAYRDADQDIEDVADAPLALADVSDVALTLPAPPEPKPVTIVPATAKLKAVHSLPARPLRRRPRSLVSGGVVTLVILVTLSSLAFVASPLARGTPLAKFSPRGAQVAGGSSQDTSTPAPWSSSSGTASGLGFGGGGGPGVTAPGSAGAVFDPHAPLPGKIGNVDPHSPVLPPPFEPWPPSDWLIGVPNHPAFAVNVPPDGYYWGSFGQCTWWAQYQRRDENLGLLGDAMYWAGNANARGLPTGVIPATGATVVFQPYVEGAGGVGHVAHVEAVYPNGWFLVSEMNFYWNGGGWGRVNFRYVYATAGVSFIY